MKVKSTKSMLVCSLCAGRTGLRNIIFTLSQRDISLIFIGVGEYFSENF